MNSENKKLKTTVAAAPVRRPVAPPVYHPQAVPKVLQKKVSPVQSPRAVQPLRAPVAPPVYRPQAKPLIAQAKMAGNSQNRKHPVAPPVYRPQVRPNTARTNSAVQRYTEPNIKELGGPGKLSENGNYFIADATPGSIYVENKALEPRRSKLDSKAGLKDYNSKKYKKYNSRKFYQDCLHTAEEVNADSRLEFKSSVRSRVVGTVGKEGHFGYTNKQNIELAEKIHPNEAAAPEPGQAYAVVNRKWKGVKAKGLVHGKWPFHVAGVVAKDGGDRITLEVFADEDAAEDRDVRGKYYMYETAAGKGRTFHEVSSSGSDFAVKPSTLVIEPK